MISRMKRDIATLKNTKIGKELTKYTIGSIYIWMFVWIFNITQKNYIVGEITLVIMLSIMICGCIIAPIARKNKNIFILFKGISLWMVSLAFLSIAYTSYYVFLKFKSILFVCITLFLYLSIFISVLIMIRIKVKSENKIRKERMNKNKTILLGSTIFFPIGYFIIGPSLNKSSQFTIHVVLICLCLFLCYILVACSPYYFVEYIISKQLHKR